MKEKKAIQYFILFYWTSFGALTVMDKIVPDVYPYWVGTDFYTLFVKFFASLGLTHPMFATLALAGVSVLEIIAFVCYLYSLWNLYKGSDKNSEQWFYRGIAFSVVLFSIFSMGDQVFGDRFNLLEHGIFWIILVMSWVIYKYSALTDDRVIRFSATKDLKLALWTGFVLTMVSSYSILDFSKRTFSNKSQPVEWEEVVPGVYKFDIPFLGDKRTLESTISAFEEQHPELRITFMYTGPDELNAKKRTHMLLYVFAERRG